MPKAPGDSVILSQLSAVAEIVANLSTRVEWRCDELLDLSLRVRDVLQAADASTVQHPLTAALLAEPAPAPGDSNGDLLDARDRHLAALREVQRSLETRPDEAVESTLRDFFGWQVAHETTLLRTGMFSAPKG